MLQTFILAFESLEYIFCVITCQGLSMKLYNGIKWMVVGPYSGFFSVVHPGVTKFFTHEIFHTL